MLPQGWIPHRRADGELIGWLEVVGDEVVAHDLLGQRVSPPGLDWDEAEQVLERRGIGYLAEPHTATVMPYGDLVRVSLTEVTTERVVAVVDELGTAAAIGSTPETIVLPFPVPVGMLREYVRPRLDLGDWRDEDGQPIAYGDRWGIDDDPPEELYSTCAHPERFAPLETVARALLDHLERRYDVDRVEVVESERTRVTLTPRSGNGVPLTVVTPAGTLPSVEVRADGRHPESWPGCGCDACDDSVPDMLDELETRVFAIVEGTAAGLPDEPWPLR